MIEPFPEQHDLIALFECEPISTDEAVPWCYNLLTFETTRGDAQITCEIEPGNQALKFRWSSSSQQLVLLDVDGIAGIQVELNEKTEAMIVTFENNKLTPLRIQLRPHVSVLWGTESELGGHK